MGAYDCDCINNLEYDRRERKQKEQPQSTTGQLNDGARSTAQSTDLIDRQAVIDLLKQMRKDGDMVPWEGKAVFARIRKLPTIQPEKAQLSQEEATSDAISRQDALDIFDDYNISVENGELEAYSRDRKRLLELPTIQSERKKGEWLPDNNNAYEMRFVCSCCKESEVVPTIGFTKYKPLWDFCPNCGADMRGEKDG